ncbi:putative membrane protein [Alkalibaculum bacchi]|uniref:Putative membrane protein n=1 Tax=Alkalibaculum bacchi TaxID=645887 RepID=A0A366I0X4_9FIRM|nr:DUF2207 domain-containing protein [Alkalibaculum bacchi]RBP61033.1 putative membrane protein [Alkalibaculum bacchi]
MKKSKCLFVFILFSLILFVALPVHAEEDLRIVNWSIDSKLKDNGDLEIIEDITFLFEDHFNGVFREIVLNNTGGVDKVKVSEILNGNPIEFTQVYDGKKGDENIYQLIEDEGTSTIQIFSPSKDEQKTFRIKYTVKDVSVKYNDTGELYYQFIGKENETPIDSFTIKIQLPQRINERVKVFAHGPTNGIIDFQGDNSILAQIREVPENTFVEARVLFPIEFIPNSTNIINEDAYNAIMAEERSYVEELEAKEIRKEKQKEFIGKYTPYLTGLWALVLSFFMFKYRRRKESIEDLNYKSYPDSVPPAIVAQLVYNMITTDTIMATIYDLARQGYLSIEEKSKYATNNFKFEKSNKSTYSLSRHEKFLMEWLFNTIGNGQKIETKDISKYGKNNPTEFSKDYHEWVKIVREETKEKGYYDESSKALGVILFITGLIAIIGGIIGMVFEAYSGILLLILGIVGIIYAIILLTRKSDYGFVQRKKWLDFRKDLKQRSKTLDIDQLPLSLDQSLIYGLVLGLGVSTLQIFQPFVSENFVPNYWIYWMFFNNNSGKNAFEESLNHSFDNSTSSIGTGGNFTGGGGGGAGGGGAGGF